MAPKKAPAATTGDPELVNVNVLSRLDHDGAVYEEGDGLVLDLTAAAALRDAGVVDYLDPPKAA